MAETTTRSTTAKPALTADFFPLSFGAFKPTGHVVIVLPDEEAATRMAQTLRAQGFIDGAVLHLDAKTMESRLQPLVLQASGAAAFGSEIQSMRRYHELARENRSFLIVRVDDDKEAEQVTDIARANNALVANRYGRIMIETLI